MNTPSLWFIVFCFHLALRLIRGPSVPKLNLSVPLAPQLSTKDSRDSKVSLLSSFTGDSSVVSGSEYDYTEDDEDMSTNDEHDLDNDSTYSRSFSGLSDVSGRLGGVPLSAQSSPHKCKAAVTSLYRSSSWVYRLLRENFVVGHSGCTDTDVQRALNAASVAPPIRCPTPQTCKFLQWGRC
jgi:hypothetical protein